MLTPDNRQLFLNALKSPEGYQFDRGIGTTFTLDLITLLITPLSLAVFDKTSIDEALQDPLILLEGLRRNADRLTIFCQAGYISIPQKDNYLYSYLEDMVVEVDAPGGGVFHPKVWLLRYVSENAPTIYRLLNLSRNLTFDRSWDLMLQLDGIVADRKVGYSQNRPLSDFIRILPDLAMREPNSRIKADVDLLYDEVRKVNFSPPTGFDGTPKFFPSGIPGYRSYRFSEYISRLMVISPFLTNNFLNQVTKNGDNHVLVSRVSSIDEISPHARKRFKQLYVLDDLADSDPEDATSLEGGVEQEISSNHENIDLTGLHAKLFIMESGRDANWLLGSANATGAAFRGHNVEFMVELKGKKSRFGINKILGNQEDDSSLLALLKPYPKPEKRIETDSNDIKAENLSNVVRKWLVAKGLSLDVQENDKSLYDLRLVDKVGGKSPNGVYSITCWPVSLPSTFAHALNAQEKNNSIVFTDISPVRITPFIAFQIDSRVAQSKHQARFVLHLPIKNLPTDRDDLIISAIIENQGQFLRYLRLLLAGETTFANSDELLRWGSHEQNTSASWEDLDLPLLEDLIRALSRSPETKIDRISEIVEQLRRTPQGQQIIPTEFDQLWQVILQARNEIQ